MSGTLNIRIDEKLKKKAEGILRDLGLNRTVAISMFYSQIVLQKGIPFPIHIPNKTTLGTFDATDKGEGLSEYNTVDELIEDSKNW